nr:lipopolysaccharide heptosyltransferase II [candidate division Zixibacteria bacterium]
MKNIVIRIPNHLGDAIMAQPAVTAFVRHCPEDRISLMLPDYTAPIYDFADRVALIGLQGRDLHGFRAIMAQRKLLSGMKYDLGYLLTPSFSSALSFFLAGVRRRCGYITDHRGPLLNGGLRPPGDGVWHRSRQYRHILESNLSLHLKSERPEIKPTDHAIGAAVGLLAAHGIRKGDAFVALAPQAIAPSRRWGSDRYGQLTRSIISEIGVGVVLIGTIHEKAAGDEIARDNPDMVNLCGETDIATATAVLSLARLFVGNDSGLAHLAAAVGLPLVVLSGADRPAETSPLADKKIVIIKDNLECISCVKNNCPLNGKAYMRCMEDITVDEVFQAVRKLWPNE